MPAEIDLSAFRIIQQAVTNAVRHSGPRDCSVTVDYREEELAIEIVDFGCGGTTASSGYGIAGAGQPAARSVQRWTLSRGRLPRDGAASSTGGGPKIIRVVLIDDQPLIRTGLRVLIADTPDLEVVGEAGNGAEAVELVKELRPDVAVMDIRMPGTDGIEAARQITADPESKTRILILTTFDDGDYVYGSLRAGTSSLLVKDMALEAILDGIRVVAVRCPAGFDTVLVDGGIEVVGPEPGCLA